jgi:hypothetical protein
VREILVPVSPYGRKEIRIYDDEGKLVEIQRIEGEGHKFDRASTALATVAPTRTPFVKSMRGNKGSHV